MALPLIWLGAAAVATYASIKYGNKLELASGVVGHFPGESQTKVTPINGAVVCCEIYGVLDHTGIWLDDGIVELSGNGLVRAISPQRFLDERSGNTIYVACDSKSNVLVQPDAAERTVAQIYSYRNYDVMTNNCHHFVWEMHSGQQTKVGRFGQLNEALHYLHGDAISWHPIS